MNTELKTFRFEQEFGSIDKLYEFLITNTNYIEDKIGIKISEESLEFRPFCMTGKENITERQILFYASENTLPENIGEMILLADAFKANIIVFIIEKINLAILSPMKWLAGISNEDTQFILAEAIFKKVDKIEEKIK